MTTEVNERDDADEERNDSSSLPATVIDTRQLFGEAREICIDHHGERYRLRITRKGRLILSK